MNVARAVKSRARCTTLEAVRASETKFTLYFFSFFARVFHHFLIKAVLRSVVILFSLKSTSFNCWKFLGTCIQSFKAFSYVFVSSVRYLCF